MALAAGEMLQSRYRIDAELAQGGMAAVYRAWDTHLEIQVAVKQMIPQPRLGPEALVQLHRQFKREAQILARLYHPNLVRVTDSFSEDDFEYLVMNFVEGESLADLVDRVGALPEAQVLNWADQLLSALTYCHSQGVIHRDVKSHNVIIRPDGQAVLVDFGLVKLWDPDDPYTKTVMRGLGTPAFAPPEQFEFETDAEHTDECSDLYSLGATLYHALTGQLPATAPLRTATPERYVPLRSIVPQVSQQTETTVMKALELARSERWQSAEEMAAALKGAEPSALDGQPGSSSASLWQRVTTGLLTEWPATKGQRRRVPRWVVVLSVLALLLVTVGLVVVGGAGGRSTPVPSPGSVAAASASAAPTGTDTATPQPTDTPSPVPTSTNTPSPVPTSTDTPSPTVTATPSVTSTSSPTPTATLTPTPTPFIHVLREGESPWIVAQLYGISVEALLAANGITDPSTLQIGQELIIPWEELARRTPTSTATPTPTPTPFIHVLQAGENPWTVAQLYGISVEELLAANGITDPTTLRIGQELIIPRVLRTPTSTFTPTIFATTAEPTIALPQLYAAPRLLEPHSDRIFGFDQRKSIRLQWLFTSLAGDHWYEVQLQRQGDEGLRGRYWTKENWWDMGPEYYRPGDYYWRVIIVQGKEDNVVGAVSPPSETWTFGWVPVAPTPILTRIPTSTPTKTSTPRPTDTPTRTPTNTPRPRTATP